MVVERPDRGAGVIAIIGFDHEGSQFYQRLFDRKLNGKCEVFEPTIFLRCPTSH